MEAQLSQAGTYAAQNYADSFFRQLPTDSRFLQVSYQKFPPSTSIDAENISFVLKKSGKTSGFTTIYYPELP